MHVPHMYTPHAHIKYSSAYSFYLIEMFICQIFDPFFIYGWVPKR